MCYDFAIIWSTNHQNRTKYEPPKPLAVLILDSKTPALAYLSSLNWIVNVFVTWSTLNIMTNVEENDNIKTHSFPMHPFSTPENIRKS